MCKDFIDWCKLVSQQHNAALLNILQNNYSVYCMILMMKVKIQIKQC